MSKLDESDHYLFAMMPAYLYYICFGSVSTLKLLISQMNKIMIVSLAAIPHVDWILVTV